jgi:hypothetical protein
VKLLHQDAETFVFDVVEETDDVLVADVLENVDFHGYHAKIRISCPALRRYPILRKEDV